MPKREPYDRIISLGGVWEPAWNIRNCFSVEEAYPFDWLITPGNSLVKMLDEDMSKALILDNLDTSHNPTTVLCRHYEILHHHDVLRIKIIRLLIERLNLSLRKSEQNIVFYGTVF
jgi:Putative papain-like cysteine peptidase (DUF1796)